MECKFKKKMSHGSDYCSHRDNKDLRSRVNLKRPRSYKKRCGVEFCPLKGKRKK